MSKKRTLKLRAPCWILQRRRAGQRGWLAVRRGAPLSIHAQTGLALAAEIGLQLCKMG